MGLWKNWNSARKAGLLRQLAAYVRNRKELAIHFVRDRILNADSDLRAALLKQGVALSLMILITVGSMTTVMAATHVATVTYDGVASQVEMTSPETDRILLKAGVKAGPNDLITRRDDPDNAGDVDITVKSARNVSLEADGTTQTVVAHYGDTVGDVLEKAGVALDGDDFSMPSKAETVENGSRIQVTRMVRITIAADGCKVAATVKEGSVSKAVQEAGVQLNSDDLLNVDRNEKVNQGMEIDVSRVTHKEVTETREIPYETILRKDSSLAAGKTRVKTAGKNGSEEVVVRQKLVDGKVTETEDIGTTVTAEPVSQVKLVGTKRSAIASISADGTVVDQNGKKVKYKKVLTGRCSCYTGGGWTSTGAKAAFGRVAVNPNVIPYGTKLYIASPDGKLVYGYATAADTGGAAMRGIIIADLYYDSYSQCMKIGTRTMNVYVL